MRPVYRPSPVGIWSVTGSTDEGHAVTAGGNHAATAGEARAAIDGIERSYCRL